MGFASELTRDAVDACYEAWGRAKQYTPPGGAAAMPCVVLIDFRDLQRRDDDPRPLAGRRRSPCEPAKSVSRGTAGVSSFRAVRP
jgi:hypothetical protein